MCTFIFDVLPYVVYTIAAGLGTTVGLIVTAYSVHIILNTPEKKKKE